MPISERVLEADVPPDETVAFEVPGLREGDVKAGSRKVTVDGVEQLDAEFADDFVNEIMYVHNRGADVWLKGVTIVMTWEGAIIEQQVADLETRVAGLEGGGSGGEGITDGSDAAPGAIGEYLVVDNMTGLTPIANAPTQVCAMALPPGCWEIWGACDFTITTGETGADTQGAPIQPNQLASGISLFADALPSQDDLILGTGVMNLIYSPLAAGQRQVLITGQCRSNSAESITLYLVGAVGSANATVKGYVSARRVR